MRRRKNGLRSGSFLTQAIMQLSLVGFSSTQRRTALSRGGSCILYPPCSPAHVVRRASGVAATMFSAAIMWWYFVPPERHLVKPAGSEYFMALTFVLAGSAISAGIGLLRRNAAELSRNQRLLQAILDHSPEAIVIKDLEGRYVLVNKAFRPSAAFRQGGPASHGQRPLSGRDRGGLGGQGKNRTRDARASALRGSESCRGTRFPVE